VHVVVARDDHTRRDVADQPGHEYQRVDDGHWQRGGDILAPWTENQLQINWRGHDHCCCAQFTVSAVNDKQLSRWREHESSFRVPLHPGTAANDALHSVLLSHLVDSPALHQKHK